MDRGRGLVAERPGHTQQRLGKAEFGERRAPGLFGWSRYSKDSRGLVDRVRSRRTVGPDPERVAAGDRPEGSERAPSCWPERRVTRRALAHFTMRSPTSKDNAAAAARGKKIDLARLLFESAESERTDAARAGWAKVSHLTFVHKRLARGDGKARPTIRSPRLSGTALAVGDRSGWPAASIIGGSRRSSHGNSRATSSFAASQASGVTWSPGLDPFPIGVVLPLRTAADLDAPLGKVHDPVLGDPRLGVGGRA